MTPIPDANLERRLPRSARAGRARPADGGAGSRRGGTPADRLLRGKAAYGEIALVQGALEELYEIFNAVLRATLSDRRGL